MAKEKKRKSKKPTPEYDSERETRVLLEAIRGEIKTVAQQHGAVMKKLDAHDNHFDRMEAALMENSVQIKGLKVGQQEIREKLDATLDNHEKRIQKLEAKAGV